MNSPSEQYYPLSFQQEEELRDYRQFPYRTASCSDVRLFRFGVQVDPTHLALAIDDLVERHAVLRTTIGRAPDHLQVVHQELPRLSRASATPADDVEKLVGQLVRRRPDLDAILSGRPLFLPQLHEVAGQLLLSLSIHHLVNDGWSWKIIWRDLAELYAARAARRPPALPPLPLCYGEFAEVQRKSWNTQRRTAVAFWTSVVSGYPGTVRWPPPAAPQAETHAASSQGFALPAECVTAVRGLARGWQASPFTVLLCATGVALSRVMGQPDLLIATDFANRVNPDVRQTVGFLSNIRLTRINLLSARSFDGLVAIVRDTWRAAEQHRDAPIGPLLDELHRPEYVKVAMDIASTVQETLTLPGVQVAEVPIMVSDPYPRKLKVQWAGEKSGYVANVTTQPSAVDPSTAAEIAGQITDVLRRPAHALRHVLRGGTTQTRAQHFRAAR